MSEKEKFDHIAYMEDGDWPNWPHLPIKCPPNKVGLLLWGYGPKVYLVNMWDTSVKLQDAETVQYDSFQAMYDAGWRVD